MRVFVDANIFKYASTRLPRYKPRKQIINWEGKEFEVMFDEFIEVNPNENIINNSILRKEVDLIPEIVCLQSKEDLEFCVTTELIMEIWGLPDMDSESGQLFGANMTKLKDPLGYSRSIMFGANLNQKEIQYKFLMGINNKRFKEI